MVLFIGILLNHFVYCSMKLTITFYFFNTLLLHKPYWHVKKTRSLIVEIDMNNSYASTIYKYTLYKQAKHIPMMTNTRVNKSLVRLFNTHDDNE